MKYIILALLALSFNFNPLVGNVDTHSLESTKNQEEVIYRTIEDIELYIWYDPDGADHEINFYMDDGSMWENLDDKGFNTGISWNIGDTIKISTDGRCGVGYNLNNDTSIDLIKMH